jgi:hypothetical protein
MAINAVNVERIKNLSTSLLTMSLLMPKIINVKYYFVGVVTHRFIESGRVFLIHQRILPIFLVINLKAGVSAPAH